MYMQLPYSIYIKSYALYKPIKAIDWKDSQRRHVFEKSFKIHMYKTMACVTCVVIAPPKESYAAEKKISST